MDESLAEQRRAWEASPGDEAARAAYARGLERAGSSWLDATLERVEGWRLRQRLCGYDAETEWVRAGAASPAGDVLYLATHTHLHAWRVPAMQREWTFGAPAFPAAQAVAVSPCGERVAAMGEAGVRVWEAATGAPLLQRDLDLEVDRRVGLSFLSASQLVCSGYLDGSVRVWDLGDPEPRVLVHDADPAAGPAWAALTPGRAQLVTASWFGAPLWVWDTETWTRRGPFGRHPAHEECAVWCLAASPDDAEVLVMYEDTLMCRYSLETLERLASGRFEERGYAADELVYLDAERVLAHQGCNYRVHLVRVADLGVSPAFTYAAGSSAVVAAPRAGLVWAQDGLRSTRDFGASAPRAAHAGPIEGLAFPEADVLVSLSADQGPRRWRRRDADFVFADDGARALGGPPEPQAPEEALLAAILGGGVSADLGGRPTPPPVRCRLSDDGRLALRAWSGELQLYELGDEQVRSDDGREGEVGHRDCAWALREDGLVAQYSGHERLLTIRDAREVDGGWWWEELEPDERLDALAFAPGGRHLAGAGDGRVYLWEVREADHESAPFALALRASWTVAPAGEGPEPHRLRLPWAVAAVTAGGEQLACTYAGRVHWIRQGERGAPDDFRVIDIDADVRGLRLEAEGRLLLVDTHGLCWVDPRDGALSDDELDLDLAPLGDAVSAAALSPSGRLAAIGTRLGAVLLYERA